MLGTNGPPPAALTHLSKGYWRDQYLIVARTWNVILQCVLGKG